MRTHSPIGTHVLDYSNLGVHTHYRIALLVSHANHRRILSGLDDAGHPGRFRVRIVKVLITLGAAIASTTHDLQERQATLSSLARKPGYSATR